MIAKVHLRRRSVSKWLEYPTYFVLFTLLSNAFLGLWARLRAGDEAVGLASAEGDPVTRFLLLLAYLSALLLGASSFLKAIQLLARAPLLVALLLWALVSVGWSEVPDVTLRRLMAMFLGTLTAALFAVRFSFREFLFLLAWVFGASLAASFVVSFVTPELGRVPEPRGEPWVGVFAQKNMLGRVALLGLLVLAWIVLSASDTKRLLLRGFWSLVFVFALFLLYKSESRTAQVVFVFALFWMVALRLARRLRRVWPAYLATLVLLIGGAGVGLVANLEAIAQLTGRDLTLTGRVPLWEIVWGYIQDRFFLGYGYGSFWLEETYGLTVAALAGWSVPHSHNGYLDLWLELGVVGVAFGLLILFSSFASWWRTYWRTGSLEALFWLTLCAVFFMYNFAESGFVRNNSLLWFLFLQMHFRTRV